MNIKKYLKIWIKTSSLSAQTWIANRGSAIMFLAGKLLRFAFFIISLLVIFGPSGQVAGYNFTELFIFFLVFNLMDSLGQIFFRGIYFFRRHVVSGEFDLTLLKPANPIFQVLTSHTDILDLPLLILVLAILSRYMVAFDLVGIFLFALLILAGFLIILTVHILVACLGIVTTEVDHAIWIFRDISSTARVPVDIYAPFLRFFLIYLIPIGVIYTFPAKGLMGNLSTANIIFALVSSIILLFIALAIWKSALKKYSSASS